MKNSRDELNVLLIEDNADDRLFLERHLRGVKKQKITVECCESLTSGLSVIAQGKTDIVFLDLSLPDSWGIDTVIRVHKQDQTIPIVILTGTDDEDIALEAINAGAQDYLIKAQLNPSLLGRSINYAIERQRGVALAQWFTALIEDTNYAVIGKSLDNKILSFNRGAERIYGYEAAEVVGKQIDLLFPSDLRNGSATALNQLKNNADIDYSESSARRKDGKVMFVSLSISPIKNSDGQSIASSVLVRDITVEKTLQKTLKETDNRLSLAAKAAKLGLWDWDLRNDNLRWDSGMFRLFGKGENHFTPTIAGLLDLVHPEDRQVVQESLAQRTAFDFDFRVVWTDLSVHHIAMKGDALGQSSELQQITGVCFDISERKSSERALQQSEQRLRLALASAKMGVWDYEMDTCKVSRSPLHDAIFGYDEVLPEWTYEMFIRQVVPEDRLTVDEQIELARVNGYFKFECRIIHAGDKSVRWISTQGEIVRDRDGKPTNMVGTITEITETKRLEHLALEDQQRREQALHAIVQHAPIGIVILDSDLKITDANAAFTSMITVDPDQLLGQSLDGVLPHEEIRAAALRTREGSPTQVARLEISAGNQKTDRKKYWDLSLWPMLDSNDCMTGAVMLVIDCTPTVMMEQQRDDFVASVAHDIKNPLIGASRILETMCNPSILSSQERYTTFVNALRDSNENLLTLVQNLVDICRYETLAYPCYFENVLPSELFGVCIQQLDHFAETSDVTIEAVVPKSVMSLRADVIGMRRVLTNLLHNAIKFNKPGGRVVLSIEQNESHTLISVTDTGEGMAEPELKSLFQRFSQGVAGKRFANGTGLGLYLSKQIVEAHAGSIDCKSVPGEGTTFIISIPNETSDVLAGSVLVPNHSQLH